MRLLIVLLIAVVLLSGVACQSQDVLSGRQVSAAETEQDVVDTWNSCCLANNFGIIPMGWLEIGSKDETMGDMYNGSNYSSDVMGLMQGMQNILAIIRVDDPTDDDLLLEVIQDPVWY